MSSTTRILRSTQRVANTPPAETRNTVSNSREKTWNDGSVSRSEVVLDDVFPDDVGSEISDVRR